MLETVLKYLSLITVAGAAISFVVGLIKYLDQRNREVRVRSFEQFNDLMRRVSAYGDQADFGLPLTQQTAAVYELQHFTDYSYASVPILEHLHAFYTEKNAPVLLLTAIEKTLEALRESH